jgi:hypothetical protein
LRLDQINADALGFANTASVVERPLKTWPLASGSERCSALLEYRSRCWWRCCDNPPMHWILEPDAKPQAWNLVMVQCEDRAGKILELEGFWTGGVWRIICDKNRRRDLRVRKWARKAGSRL